MKSNNIVFTDRKQVELRDESVKAPGFGQVLCAANKSLVSTGTELACLNGDYDKETYREDFIQYPFYPGYSMAAEVIEVGEGVEHLNIGDRITTWTKHRQYFTVNETDCFKTPDDVTHEEATWNTLARTTQ